MSSAATAPDGTVRAAGTLPWREDSSDGRAGLQVALVHRPRYDDWSWPKGKLEAGEHWPAAAARETLEETGLVVRLGLPLPTATYEVNGHPKVVRYWAAAVAGGDGALEHEVDEVAWCTPDEARARLTHARDTVPLDALVAAHADGTLAARPFAVVRHAKARPRKKWKKPDWRRPLDDRGRGEAAALVGVLGAYGIDRVVTSTSVRCVATVEPYANAADPTFVTTKRLSEEGYAAAPAKAVATLEAELGRPRRTALCSHGPVLPDLLAALAVHADAPLPGVADEPGAAGAAGGASGAGGEAAESSETAEAVGAVLAQAREENLDKGEALVAHVLGDGIRVVAVERHRPDDAA